MSSTRSQIYNGAATIGKIQMGFSGFICLLISICLYYWAYHNNKNWNYNIVDITGIIIKINTESGSCDTFIQQNSNSSTVTYICPLTAEFVTDNISSGSVSLTTNSSTNYVVGQSIGLSFNKKTNEVSLPELRIHSPFIFGIATFFLLSAYINYKIATSEAAKPYLAGVGVVGVGNQIF